MNARYSIGIDLGTTNSVAAYTLLDVKTPTIEILPIPQLTDPHQSESLPSLPSFAYFPTEQERGEGGLSSFGEVCVGTYARRISAEQPERTIAAAKSWLCHREVDRRAPILPWQAPDEVPKLSPVQASALFLKRIVCSLVRSFSCGSDRRAKSYLNDPASFDVVARELTLEAAREAGLPEDLILLEEPQAALFHWIQSHGTIGVPVSRPTIEFWFATAGAVQPTCLFYKSTTKRAN